MIFLIKRELGKVFDLFCVFSCFKVDLGEHQGYMANVVAFHKRLNSTRHRGAAAHSECLKKYFKRTFYKIKYFIFEMAKKNNQTPVQFG